MAGHSRIILITDAIETDGDAITAVRAAAEAESLNFAQKIYENGGGLPIYSANDILNVKFSRMSMITARGFLYW